MAHKLIFILSFLPAMIFMAAWSFDSTEPAQQTMKTTKAGTENKQPIIFHRTIRSAALLDRTNGPAPFYKIAAYFGRCLAGARLLNAQRLDGKGRKFTGPVGKS